MISTKLFYILYHYCIEELDGLAVSEHRRTIAEVKQCWSVIGWVTKNLLSRAPPCFRRHVKPCFKRHVKFSLCVIHKGALCPSSGDINRMIITVYNCVISYSHFI
jgi:hypothetical protein